MTRLASNFMPHGNLLCIGCSDWFADDSSFFHSRVAELEQENARLLASIHHQQPSTLVVPANAEDGLKSELELLKRQLAETQQRERELAQKLSSIPEPAPVDKPAVKMEVVEPQLPVSLRAHKGERSGASFGLMVRPILFSPFLRAEMNMGCGIGPPLRAPHAPLHAHAQRDAEQHVVQPLPPTLAFALDFAGYDRVPA